MDIELSWQRSLFGSAPVAFDVEYRNLRRNQLDATAWIDHAPGWITGAETLFEEILEARKWGQRSRLMYDNLVQEPRLTAPWSLRSGEPLAPPVLEDIRLALSARYGVQFDSVGFNLYRDGRDSVAWHGDRILPEIVDPVVALISLGGRRKFLLRPRGGGRSLAWMLGDGDLFVTGGATQRTWEHAVPKVAQADPRISLAYRHGLAPSALASQTTTPI